MRLATHKQWFWQSYKAWTQWTVLKAAMTSNFLSQSIIYLCGWLNHFKFILFHRGMDPLAFTVVCGIASGLAGFVLGGATFNFVWTVLFRRKAHQIREVQLCTCTHCKAIILYCHVNFSLDTEWFETGDC